MTLQRTARMFRQMKGQANQTACASPVGDFQFVILMALAEADTPLAVNAIFEYAYKQTEDSLDVAQTYLALDRFQAPDRGWVKEAKPIHLPTSRRPVTTFQITTKGRAALQARIAHLERLCRLGRRLQGASGA